MVSVSDFGFNEEEYAEEVKKKFLPSGWPKPLAFAGDQPARWRLIYEIYNQSVEALYFWTLDNLPLIGAFHEFDKITDVFSASEQSAFFGVAQQRLGLQQDKVSQFLATIGKMIKELFQLVRELRIIDERMEYYLSSNKGDLASEITLKGYWIDLVEGGAKNPASVYGMSRELQFVTLPDIFFGTPPMPSANVQNYVEGLSFNRKVKEVLMRKLKSYIVWKEHTQKELLNRRTFTIKYLRQHYDIIRMYMAWVKPYLRNIRRMQLDAKRMDTADLIAAFEGSVIEIEYLAKHDVGNGVYAILDMHFFYRSRPSMSYQQEGYQRGPIHVGKSIVTVRAYSWTKEEVEQYKKYREKEDMDLLKTVDASVQAAYESLGDELEKYLAEAGEIMPEKRGSAQDHGGHHLTNPFTSVFQGFGELGKAFFPQSRELRCPSCKMKITTAGVSCYHCGSSLRKPSKKEMLAIQNAKDKAKDHLETQMYQFVKRFKAAFGFMY